MREKMHHTSMAIGSYWTAYMQRLVRSGRYGNKSEVIRSGLRLLQQYEQDQSQGRRTKGRPHV